jgi:hypothetical protein
MMQSLPGWSRRIVGFAIVGASILLAVAVTVTLTLPRLPEAAERV